MVLDSMRESCVAANKEIAVISNKSDLTSALNGWLASSIILDRTRKLLKSGAPSTERSGLSDGQIANWKRRGLPESILEGAALYHCAKDRNLHLDTAKRLGIEADTFWQVFIVHAAENDDQLKLDCTILRYWQGVRALRGTVYLTHTAHRSAGEGASDDKPRSLVEGDCGFDPGDDDDGGVFVSWEVEAGREPRDHGYAVRFSRVMEREHEEALGGSPTIPVATAHLLAFLPREVLDHQRRKRLPSNPRGRPIAFSTLLHGDPTRVIESYLGIRKSPANGDFRRLGPWFKEGPLVEPLGDRLQWCAATHPRAQVRRRSENIGVRALWRASRQSRRVPQLFHDLRRLAARLTRLLSVPPSRHQLMSVCLPTALSGTIRKVTPSGAR